MKARETFIQGNPKSLKDQLSQFHNIHLARDWLVTNVKGMGYKEASHFLRNIGQGMDFAILDRHILRFLTRVGLIEVMPTSLRPKDYKYYEQILRDFSNHLSIPLGHLDFILWFIETGRIFK